MKKYFRPINSFGYRDVEHDANQFLNRQLIVVTGDSFVAGHGIRDINDRFSNILQKNLGDGFVVANVGMNGWETRDELQALSCFPYRPKKVVLSYYINDILGAARRTGHGSPVRVEPPGNQLLSYVIDHSYTFNFAYWRLYIFNNRDLGEKYWPFVQQAYSDPDIWEAHKGELIDFANYTQNQK
jgi:hypothetical protein